MINYNNGKIYKIEPICDHEEHEIYIGSTTKQYLSQRMTAHRCNYKKFYEGKYHKITVFDIFDKYGIENCNIFLIENFSCNSKDELHSREGYYIKLFKCVNRITPGQTQREYYQINKEKIIKYHKEYCENNKEKIAENNKQYQQNNKEILSNYKKEYRFNNKDKIKEFRNKVEICVCGKTYTHDNFKRHTKSKHHQDYLKSEL
jgi:hypothetical protein